MKGAPSGSRGVSLSWRAHPTPRNFVWVSTSFLHYCSLIWSLKVHYFCENPSKVSGL
jgi:hypothetical protein